MARRQHGPLTIEEISKGLKACIDNVSDLVLDAEVLIQARRSTRALTCLLVAGQELGKIHYLQAMPTFDLDDSARWKQFWSGFYNHKSKAASGLLALLGSSTSAQEVGRLALVLNAGIGGSAEDERNRTLYVDFEDKARLWSSPLPDSSGFTTRLLDLTRRALAHILGDRDAGLQSPKALKIIQDVCASNQILDPGETDDPTAEITEYTRKLFARNEFIRERLTAEGFDLNT